MSRRSQVFQQLGWWKTNALLRASLFGGLAFLSVCDFRILNVTRVRWLLVGDSAQSYIAWEFFRKTPLLQWPLGNNPDFGKGFSSSIVFSDSVPLLAVLLKPIAKLVESDLQYFGWWLLLCFILQAFFALKLFTEFLMPTWAQVVALPLLLLQPALLDRMSFDGYGHMALSAHWIILAGIWLFIRTQSTHRSWAVLLLISVGVTFYFFVIVFGMMLIWSTTNIIQSASHRRQFAQEIRAIVLILFGSFLFVYLLGGLQSGSLQDSGLGIYRTTVGSLLDSSTNTGQRWSRLLTFADQQSSFGTHEGFGYIGSGVLVLALVVVLTLVRRGGSLNVRRILPLLAVGGLFFVLSLSPSIALGNRELFSYPIPKVIEQILGIIRATGRFIWVPMYLLIFGIVVLLGKQLKHQHRLLAITLVAASLFHIFDSAPALVETRERFVAVNPTFITDDSIWDDYARNKDHLVAIPPLSNDPRWIELALVALRNDMSTTASYVARKDETAFQQLVEISQTALEQRDFALDTLYVITNYPPNPETPKILSEYESGQLRRLRVIQVEELTVIVRDS